VKNLKETVDGVFPREQDYGKVYALFLSWEDGMSGVKGEIEKLNETLQHLRFASSGDTYASEHFEIPGPTKQVPGQSDWPEAKLEERLVAVRNQHMAEANSLLIVYYGGHSKIDPDTGRSIWFAKKTSTTPFLDWSDLQGRLKKSNGNILFLLDCCAGLGMVDTSPDWAGTKELLSATSKSSQTTGVSNTSFTSTLVEAIKQKKGEIFNISELQAYMVGNTGEWGACLVLRWPLFVLACPKKANENSILLRYPKKPVPRGQAAPDALLSPMRVDAESRVRGLFAIRLENPSRPVPVDDWTVWLKSQAPAGISSVDIFWDYVRTEGVFHGRSTLMLVSTPISAWNLLPTTRPTLLSILSSLKI
jgi:hypothetical protein